ncbi:hypothetical protein M8C21_020954, partial [Ambrosia artemisiifolia]
MTTGHEDSSYAKNSLLQKIAIQKAIPALRRTIQSINSHDIFLDSCVTIADLGCSSGPNTLLVVSCIIDIVIEVCKEDNHKPRQFQVCLNDLFGNDFNTLFKLVSDFYAKLKKEKGENFGPCFVSAVPGSFYGRLFPDLSLHLVHSSFSVSMIALLKANIGISLLLFCILTLYNLYLDATRFIILKVPEGIENNALNIYTAKTSPPNVFQAYAYQFRTDFTCFLKMRSKEIVSGGGMVLTFLGRSIDDPTSDDGCSYLEQLALSLRDLVKEGMVRESDINSFNVPTYHPCVNEVK